MTSINLNLQDLSCQHCVKNVKQTLEKISGVERADVSLTQATVIGDVPAQTLIDAIVEAGYQAQLADPK
ncbi:cation transporter [Lonepinella koalarum]|uniref:Copper chaperone CopZ n=1 Tax=Lonepinella koalarum TaxID=53417 RepID=A0A4R1KWY5_9PAST|nr:cation transporter [Lonepinella koalarum]TCK69835.1 copper chaperone CopZ [Lonepinella koalarum]